MHRPTIRAASPPPAAIHSRSTSSNVRAAMANEKEEMLRIMRRREEEHRKKEEELRMQRERERIRYERERLEREKLELQQLRLTAQLAASAQLNSLNAAGVVQQPSGVVNPVASDVGPKSSGRDGTGKSAPMDNHRSRDNTTRPTDRYFETSFHQLRKQVQ